MLYLQFYYQYCNDDFSTDTEHNPMADHEWKWNVIRPILILPSTENAPLTLMCYYRKCYIDPNVRIQTLRMLTYWQRSLLDPSEL